LVQRPGPRLDIFRFEVLRLFVPTVTSTARWTAIRATLVAGAITLQRLPAVRFLAAMAAFCRTLLGPAAISLAACPPHALAGLQNPLLPLRRVWLVKPAVSVLDAHERRNPSEFLLDQKAIGRRLDQIAVIGPISRGARLLARDRYQVARFGAHQRVRLAFQPVAVGHKDRAISRHVSRVRFRTLQSPRKALTLSWSLHLTESKPVVHIDRCNLVHDRQNARTSERQGSSSRLIENGAKRKDIRAGIQRLASRLFRVAEHCR
jgi:hypothetical protein